MRRRGPARYLRLHSTRQASRQRSGDPPPRVRLPGAPVLVVLALFAAPAAAERVVLRAQVPIERSAPNGGCIDATLDVAPPGPGVWTSCAGAVDGRRPSQPQGDGCLATGFYVPPGDCTANSAWIEARFWGRDSFGILRIYTTPEIQTKDWFRPQGGPLEVLVTDRDAPPDEGLIFAAGFEPGDCSEWSAVVGGCEVPPPPPPPPPPFDCEAEPSCIFADGFESGDTSEWSDTDG